MSLGERIRQLRDERDLSLRELAKKLGCSAAFLSDIELGRRYPAEKNLRDLARILNVSFDELKSHDNRPPVEEMKRLSAKDPLYAVAFRTMIDRNLSAEDLLKLAESAVHPKKKLP
jgi:transcriptional regulator with XRE-family HTH domain